MSTTFWFVLLRSWAWKRWQTELTVWKYWAIPKLHKTKHANQTFYQFQVSTSKTSSFKYISHDWLSKLKQHFNEIKEIVNNMEMTKLEITECRFWSKMIQKKGKRIYQKRLYKKASLSTICLSEWREYIHNSVLCSLR